MHPQAHKLWEFIKNADISFTCYNKAEFDKFIAVFSRKELVSILCELSISEKWNIDSEYDTDDKCPFCKFSCAVRGVTWDLKTGCAECLCPYEICHSHAAGGIIADLEDKPIQDMIVKELRNVVEAFSNYII